MKTYDEIAKIAEETWPAWSKWNMTYDKMAELTDPTGDEESSGWDTIFTNPNGDRLVRYEANILLNAWSTYLEGFIAAYRMLDKE